MCMFDIGCDIGYLSVRLFCATYSILSFSSLLTQSLPICPFSSASFLHPLRVSLPDPPPGLRRILTKRLSVPSPFRLRDREAVIDIVRDQDVVACRKLFPIEHWLPSLARRYLDLLPTRFLLAFDYLCWPVQGIEFAALSMNAQLETLLKPVGRTTHSDVCDALE